MLALLGAELLLHVDKDIFHFAQLGPDPLIFYRFCFPFVRKGGNHRGAIMHTEKTGEFLLRLAQKCRTRETFSFLAGFLCHYSLDSVVHPYINKLTNGEAHLHMAIEHQLDLHVLSHTGKPLRRLMDLFAPYHTNLAFSEALRQVYGWDDDCYRKGYRYMKWFYAVTKDSRGVLNKLLKLFPEQFSALSYRTELCKDVDLSEYEVLELQAVREAVVMIRAAYRYWYGELSFEELCRQFGDRSYC